MVSLFVLSAIQYNKEHCVKVTNKTNKTLSRLAVHSRFPTKTSTNFPTSCPRNILHDHVYFILYPALKLSS